MDTFRRLMQVATRQQATLLGGVSAHYRSGSQTKPTTVVVHRDVEVLIDAGRALAKKTLVDVLKEDVPTCKQGDTITTSSGEKFIVSEIHTEDDYLTQVMVR